VRRRDGILAAARLSLQQAAARRQRAADRVAVTALGVCAGAVRTCESLREKAALLDPERLFDRGYSLTLGPTGQVLRDAGAVRPGDRLTTRLRGGRIESIVDEIDKT